MDSHHCACIFYIPVWPWQMERWNVTFFWWRVYTPDVLQKWTVSPVPACVFPKVKYQTPTRAACHSTHYLHLEIPLHHVMKSFCLLGKSPAKKMPMFFDNYHINSQDIPIKTCSKKYSLTLSNEFVPRTARNHFEKAKWKKYVMDCIFFVRKGQLTKLRCPT